MTGIPGPMILGSADRQQSGSSTVFFALCYLHRRPIGDNTSYSKIAVVDICAIGYVFLCGYHMQIILKLYCKIQFSTFILLITQKEDHAIIGKNTFPVTAWSI